MILIYDKTFEGFLSLVYDVYYEKLKPSSILSSFPNTLLLEEVKTIKTEEEKYEKVLNAIKTKFDKTSFNRILNIFLCDNEEFELDLLNYIIIGFKDKNELHNINRTNIQRVQKLEKELFRTVHKMYGFVRFVELDDETLYAKIESKQNILYFLAKHFNKRLNNQKFIIHDINRKIAFIKNENFFGIQNIASFEEPKLSQNEEKFNKLWTTFFNSVAIESRKNKKLQQNLVPLIYRTYMTEFND